MNLISTITNDPNQTMTIILDDGSSMDFTLRYVAGLKGWYYSFTWGAFSFLNRRLVVNPNMLRIYKGILTFGLACYTKDNYEPIYIDDFSSGRAQFYTLNQIDVDNYEQQLSNAKV